LKLWKLPKINGYILKYKVSPLWPTYIGGRTTTLAKGYGIKVRCYGLCWGTHWELGEHIGNLKGT